MGRVPIRDFIRMKTDLKRTMATGNAGTLFYVKEVNGGAFMDASSYGVNRNWCIFRDID